MKYKKTGFSLPRIISLIDTKQVKEIDRDTANEGFIKLGFE